MASRPNSEKPPRTETSMKKGVMLQAWYIQCGEDGCEKYEILPECSSLKARYTMINMGWIETLREGWVCPNCLLGVLTTSGSADNSVEMGAS